MSSLVQIYDFPRPVLVFPLFPRGGRRLIWACDEGCCDIQLLCWHFALGVEWVSPVLDSVSVHVVVGLWPLSSLHSPGSAHASLTHATVLFCISTVHCLRLTAERNAFEFSSFLADHRVDVVTYFRHLKHSLLPLVLDLVSAFGLILQQYSLTSADGIQRDVLIKRVFHFIALSCILLLACLYARSRFLQWCKTQSEQGVRRSVFSMVSMIMQCSVKPFCLCIALWPVGCCPWFLDTILVAQFRNYSRLKVASLIRMYTLGNPVFLKPFLYVSCGLCHLVSCGNCNCELCKHIHED